MRATLDLSGEPDRIIGLWQESGGTYSVSTLYEVDGANRSTLYVAGTTPLSSSPEDDLQPFVVRLTVPDSIADQMLEPDAWLKLKLFDQDVTLVEDDTFIPDDEPSAGMKHLYIASSNKPKLYAFVEEFKGSLAPNEAFDDEEFRLELVTSSNDEVVYDASAGVELQPTQQQQSAARLDRTLENAPRFASLNTTPLMMPNFAIAQSGGSTGGGNYSPEEVLTWFKFLFGRYGEELLDAYTGTITVEPLDNLIPWHWKRYRVENWMQSDANDGKALIIRLDNDQKSAVQAAQALFFAFQDCRSWLARYDFNLAVFDGVLQDAINGDADGADLYNAYYQGNIAPIAEALGDCALAGEIGLSIANVGADVVFTLNDVATHAQAGQWKQAGTTLAMGAVFVGPVMKLAKRTGKKVVIESLEGTFEITARVQEALIDVTGAANRAEKMAKLRPLVASGDLGDDFIRWAYENTALLTESRGQLRRALLAKVDGRQPAKAAAHHYLPIHYSEDLELKFLMTGLDPNDVSLGTWMDKKFHLRIHGKGLSGQGWGPGGPWNYQWRRFFATAAQTRTAEEVMDFLDELKAVISDATKPVDEMDWPHRPNGN